MGDSVSAFGNALVQMTDIDNHWAKEEIDFMTAEGVIDGYERWGRETLFTDYK